MKQILKDNGETYLLVYKEKDMIILNSPNMSNMMIKLDIKALDQLIEALKSLKKSISKSKTNPVLTHCLARPLKEGGCGAAAHKNSLMIAIITKLNPKMIRVARVGHRASQWNTGEHNKYSSECALLDGPDVTMYLLSKQYS